MLEAVQRNGVSYPIRSIVKRFRPRCRYGIVCLMDSPSFPTGGSAPDARVARPAPDVVRRPDRSPAARPARPLASAPPASPVRAARVGGTHHRTPVLHRAEHADSAAARSVPALDDDTPVDNLPSEKQQRLLTEPLYNSWGRPRRRRPFLAAAKRGRVPGTAQSGTPPLVGLGVRHGSA